MKLNKERKLIIIIGGILILAGGGYRFSGQMENLFSSDHNILIQNQKISKYHNIANQRDYYENRLNDLNRKIEKAHTLLLNGTTPSLAAVDLQNVINDILSRNGIKAKTIRVLKTEKIKDSDYLIIPVEVSFEASIRQLKDIVFQLESYSRFLLIQKTTLFRDMSKKDRSMIKTTLSVAGLSNA